MQVCKSVGKIRPHCLGDQGTGTEAQPAQLGQAKPGFQTGNSLGRPVKTDKDCVCEDDDWADSSGRPRRSSETCQDFTSSLY
jgi:hypothetical protein